MNYKKQIFAISSVLLSILVVFSLQIKSQTGDPGWPRQISKKAGTMIYYQPQVDNWKSFSDIDFRMAFSLTPAKKKSVVGILAVHAMTSVDIEKRTVYVYDISIRDTRFQSVEPEAVAGLSEMMKEFMPTDSVLSISLDRLVALTEKSSEVNTVDVRNDPPLIFVSNRPAMLVQIDGEPVKGKIKDTGLEFFVNSNFPVFFDTAAKKYYVFTGKMWLTATDPKGAWTYTTILPKDMNKVKKDKDWAELATAIPAPRSTEPVPTVFYASSPAEVILFQGKPLYTPIAGTDLAFASNTESDVFLHKATQTYYFLVAGRWFSASNLAGPWTFATPNLPPDFAKIPVKSKASRVLVSVPGTEQAMDAVLLAQVPTTAIVDPKAAAAEAKVTYTGDPEFKPIDGTTMQYAVNTTDRVIKVGDVYYLCLNGVWFFSATANGPWTTAASVPKEIYTIPPSSPVYNVTYVTQTTTSSGYVMSSYTSGYYGTFVVRVGFVTVIAWGTGYYYRPYYYYPVYGYPIYWHYPVTYGFGAYYSVYRGYGVYRGVYGPYAGAVRYAGYNPYTGTYARGATVYGPYGSRSAGRAYNPYTGTAAVTRQGSSAYGQWGTSVISNGNQAVRTGSISNSQGTIVGAKSTTGAKAIAGSGPNNSGAVVKTAGGDVYAGKNGNVYKNTGSGWQKYDNGSWSSVAPPKPQQQGAASTTAAQSRQTMDRGTYDSLNREAQNRQRGTMQTQSYQRYGGMSAGSRSYSRAGGRGRRR